MAPDQLLDLLYHFLAYADHVGDSTPVRDLDKAARLVVRADQTMTAMARFLAVARPGPGRHRRR
jgi:hypothetical protein